MKKGTVFAPTAWSNYQEWQNQSKKITERINRLINETNPKSAGNDIGKPEILTGDLAGWKAKRIDGEHRLVYRITQNNIFYRIEILSCYGHYDNIKKSDKDF